MHAYHCVQTQIRKKPFHPLLHYRTSMGIVITEHRASTIVNDDWIKWLMIVIMIIGIPVLLVIVCTGWMRCMVGECMALIMMLLIVVVRGAIVVFRIVWKWPKLGSSSRLPHFLENFLSIHPPCDCHLLHAHVYVNIIHSCIQSWDSLQV